MSVVSEKKPVLCQNGDVLFRKVLYTHLEHEDLHPLFKDIYECPAVIRKKLGLPLGWDVMDVETPAVFRKRAKLKLLDLRKQEVHTCHALTKSDDCTCLRCS